MFCISLVLLQVTSLICTMTKTLMNIEFDLSQCFEKNLLLSSCIIICLQNAFLLVSAEITDNFDTLLVISCWH